MPRKASTALAAILFAAGVGSASAGDGTMVYKLGPLDHLMVKVYDFRTGSGEAFQWQALNGEFVVGADGAVSLPLLGEVKAAGITSGDLADSIANAMQAKVGLTNKPDASVQVIKYRPFYVSGSVQKPGQYEYNPGLTVLQAVSIAQGVGRSGTTDTAYYEHQAMTGRGDMRLLDAERVALLAHQARVDAEVSDASGLVFPSEVLRRGSEPSVARAMREETLLFNARRDALAAQLAAIDQARVVLRSEIETLAAKHKTLEKSIVEANRDLANATDLRDKGMGTQPRQFAAEQTASALETQLLDTELTTLRANQELSRTDRDVIELKARYRTESLSEANDVRAKLDAAGEKMATAQGLVRDAEVRAPELGSEASELRPEYSITRVDDGHSATLAAGEGDGVQPGDVVRVTLARADRPSQLRSSVPAIPYVPAAAAPAPLTSSLLPSAGSPTAPQPVAQAAPAPSPIPSAPATHVADERPAVAASPSAPPRQPASAAPAGAAPDAGTARVARRHRTRSDAPQAGGAGQRTHAADRRSVIDQDF